MPTPTMRKLMMMGGPRYWQRIKNMYPANLLYWPLSDLSGRVCDEITGKTVSLDVVDNGGFETAGAGGADVFGSWSETVGDGAIADEGVIVHGGSHAATLTAGASANTTIRAKNAGSASAGQNINTIPGVTYTVTFWTRGDGVNAGRYSIYDYGSSAWIRTLITTGVTGAVYTQVSFTFTAGPNCTDIGLSLWCPGANGGIAYFDDVSVTCAEPLDAIYSTLGTTLGQSGIGDGKTSVAVTGGDSGIRLGSKAFNSLWNGNVGSSIAWAKVDGAARWLDATSWRYTFHVKSRPLETVYIAYGKSSTDHQLWWRRRCAVGAYDITYTFSPNGTLDWFCQGMTWDMVSNPKRIACYLYTKADGVWQKVSDAAPATGNENWDKGTYPADDPNVSLLAGTPTTQEWIGNGQHIALWNGIVLTDAEMRQVMVP